MPCARTSSSARVRSRAALAYYEAAAEKTASIPERNYLLLKLGRLRAN